MPALNFIITPSSPCFIPLCIFHSLLISASSSTLSFRYHNLPVDVHAKQEPQECYKRLETFIENKCVRRIDHFKISHTVWGKNKVSLTCAKISKDDVQEEVDFKS
ncbi:unnamed protein product [Sphenostylis stenocarpa]|uniref:Uncharacterized protein n=1 Tax=Sphenostylis stenocarpa TaxID=92480 RepID=A0AA86VB91_9FABA|nr:unnamed protein product [Sphenostylis stenocarpa]